MSLADSAGANLTHQRFEAFHERRSYIRRKTSLHLQAPNREPHHIVFTKTSGINQDSFGRLNDIEPHEHGRTIMNQIARLFALFVLFGGSAHATVDILVSKSVDNATPIANEPVEFTIRATNLGDTTATDVIVTEQLPLEMAIPTGTAAFPGTGSFDSQSGEWSVGNIEAGQEFVLVVPAVISSQNPPACIANIATSSHPDDVDSTNNEGRAVVYGDTTAHCVDLSSNFGISVPEFFIFPDCDSKQRFEGSIDVHNSGPDVARNVNIAVSQFPVIGATVVFADARCAISGRNSCAISEIQPGETIDLNVTSAEFQNYTSQSGRFEIEVSTSDFDYLSENDLASADGTVEGFSGCDEPDFGVGPEVAIGPACLIATAAYGTSMHPHLNSLREFRDQQMMTNSFGRILVNFYYRHSPPIAEAIAERDWLRAIVRGLLRPIVFTVRNPWLAFLLILGLTGIIVLRRIRHARLHDVSSPSQVFSAAKPSL
jgi:uncharacterized repeat protein (TIGR01451 family)